MHSRRQIFVAVYVLAFLAMISATFANEPQPLRILLTNDDGWDAPGIQAMKSGLEAAGHVVTLVAPSANRSGSSAALSVTGPVTVSQQNTNEYAVDGTPATCVLIGLVLIEEPPDLVVSGANLGFNGGPPSIHSGTLGAALTGLSKGISAIVVATDPPTNDETDPAFVAHFTTVAEFTARLIATLQRRSHGPEGLLSPRVGIKIGYPPLRPEEISGVALAEQGDFSRFDISYQELSPGVFIPALIPTDPSDADPRGDVAKYLNGFITILPFENDITAQRRDRSRIGLALKGLKP